MHAVARRNSDAANGGEQPVATPAVVPCDAPPLRLSRKRAAAAALPSLALGGMGGRRSGDDEGKRKRAESSGSCSQTSSSGSDSEASLSGPPEKARSEERFESPMGGGIYEDPPSSSSSVTPGSSYCHTIPADTVVSEHCIKHSQITVSLAKGAKTARIVIGNHRRNQEKGPLLENGTRVGPYTIVGAGKECPAVHVQTGAIVQAQVISRSELETLEAVAARLEKAEELCIDYPEWDVPELCELILPSSCEIVEESTTGRIILFSPSVHSSLHSHIHRNACGLPEHDVVFIFKQTVRLLAFCHTLGIIVRDLKPRKLVFIDEAQTRLRLSDVFDVAVCDSIENDVVNEKFGSPAYVPPEVLSSSSCGFAGRPADIWGLGVLTYLLLVGKYPFFDSTPKGVFDKIRRAKIAFPQGCKLSLAARMIVHGLLRKRLAERPTAVWLLSMPWARPLDSTAYYGSQTRLNHMATPTFTSTRVLASTIQMVAYALRDFPETTAVQEVPSGGERSRTSSEAHQEAARHQRSRQREELESEQGAAETEGGLSLVRSIFPTERIRSSEEDQVVPQSFGPRSQAPLPSFDYAATTQLISRQPGMPHMLTNVLHLSRAAVRYATGDHSVSLNE